MFQRGLNVLRMEVYQTDHQKTPKPLMQLSLHHLLTQFGSLLQQRLFPRVEEELGPLSKKHQHLITVLALACIEPHLDAPHSGPGRPSHDRVALARAFVAKAIFDLPTTGLLIQLLESDSSLRRICGWESSSGVPDKSVFSRAFAAFSEAELPQRIHEALVLQTQKERLVGHISRDATSVLVRERVPKSAAPSAEVAKAAPPRRRKRGEPKPPEKMTRIERQQTMTLEEMLAELPKQCAVGAKTNSQGRKETWRGYKLHLDVADGQIPVSAVLTSASLHDSQVAIPLSRMTARRLTNLYDLMDSAYDCAALRNTSIELGHVPIIERLERGKGLVPMAPHEAQRYKGRTASERVNARLKDEFGGRFIRVRGHAKVMAHLMFGLIALTVDQILRLTG